MKQCRNCNTEKPRDEFYKHKSNKDGLHSYCKSCVRDKANSHYKENSSWVKERIRKHRIDNLDEYRAKDNARWQDRKEYRSTYMGHYNSKRRGKMPTWANEEAILDFYRSAEKLRMILGEWYAVDHIVPLKSPLVCGLHNEFNLQVLTESENNSKQNRYWPDMP